jgi:hypothetical protein
MQQLSQQLIDEIGGHFDQVYVNAHSVRYFSSAEIAFQQLSHLIDEFSLHVLYTTP